MEGAAESKSIRSGSAESPVPRLLGEIPTARERNQRRVDGQGSVSWCLQGGLVCLGKAQAIQVAIYVISDARTEGHWLKTGREIMLFAHSQLIKTRFSIHLSSD